MGDANNSFSNPKTNGLSTTWMHTIVVKQSFGRIHYFENMVPSNLKSIKAYMGIEYDDSFIKVPAGQEYLYNKLFIRT